MLRAHPLATQVGWLLALTVTGLALVPSTQWGWLVAKGVALLVLLFYIWRVNARDRMPKHLTLSIEGVADELVPWYEEQLAAVFGRGLRVHPRRGEETHLVFDVLTQDTLAAVTRRLKRARLAVGLMQMAGRLEYTAVEAQASMRVQVDGIASSHSEVFIEGLDRPVRADAHGRFTMSVPFSVLKAHRRRGYLPGRWRKDQVEERIRVPIPT